ncbi:MAG: hypothetical protein RBT69_04015 [Spirochaetia bacterium]|jgi:phosphoglycolate phosphatase-like HAD superfamily hydrolase|nr:hypothetical protein [Spirochaetia bacterium]
MKNERILFLDFDGVICDSSRETARTGWLAGSELWEDWRGVDLPQKHLQKFIKLRPLLETGYEAIALIKAIDEGYSESFLKNEFNFIKEQIFTSVSMNRNNLIKLYGKVRADWARLKPANWLSWHLLYDCAPALVDAGMRNFSSCHIITTKEKEFVKKLLPFFRISFDPGMIHGLETGKSKKEIILEILEQDEFLPENTYIIEDRLRTIYSLQSCGELASAFFYLASWGYVFPEEIEEAGESEGITVLDPDEVLDFPEN